MLWINHIINLQVHGEKDELNFMVGVEFYCSYIKYVHVMSFLLSLLFLLYCLILCSRFHSRE